MNMIDIFRHDEVGEIAERHTGHTDMQYSIAMLWDMTHEHVLCMEHGGESVTEERVLDYMARQILFEVFDEDEIFDPTQEEIENVIPIAHDALDVFKRAYMTWQIQGGKTA